MFDAASLILMKAVTFVLQGKNLARNIFIILDDVT